MLQQWSFQSQASIVSVNEQKKTNRKTNLNGRHVCQYCRSKNHASKMHVTTDKNLF
jgi:hypothetical protein